MRVIRGLSIVLLVVAGTSVARGADRWYVGGSYGEVDFGSGVAAFDDGSLTAGEVDGDDSGWKLFGGFRLTKRASIEVGYLDLNTDVDERTTFSGMSDGTGTDYAAGSVSVDEELTGWLVEVVDRVSLSRRLGLLVKVGALHWEADITTIDTVGTVDTDDDGTNLVYGAGLDYPFKSGLALRVEWERFTNVIRDDVEMISAGLSYIF